MLILLLSFHRLSSHIYSLYSNHLFKPCSDSHNFILLFRGWERKFWFCDSFVIFTQTTTDLLLSVSSAEPPDANSVCSAEPPDANSVSSAELGGLYIIRVSSGCWTHCSRRVRYEACLVTDWSVWCLVISDGLDSSALSLQIETRESWISFYLSHRVIAGWCCRLKHLQLFWQSSVSNLSSSLLPTVLLL